MSSAMATQQFTANVLRTGARNARKAPRAASRMTVRAAQTDLTLPIDLRGECPFRPPVVVPRPMRRPSPTRIFPRIDARSMRRRLQSLATRRRRIGARPGRRQISTLRPQNDATDRYRSSDLSFPRWSSSTGKKAFVAGVADDQGFGWAISKCLAQAGCEVILGTWVPALNIFETSLRRGKFDESRKLSDGSLMEFAKVYPMDAVFDTYDDVPEEIRTNKRYAGNEKWTVAECAEQVEKDFGKIDILVHSLANGPEVAKPLLETSRNGYLAALSASSYSKVSMLQRFGPIMNEGGAAISLTYLASEKIIPGYGGGMSSAKAALESDTQVLAYEAGRKWGIRVNTISAGPLGSRAAKAIGFIDDMINYSLTNAPLAEKPLTAMEIGQTAAFLCSPLASGITGSCIYVDNGLHAMGLATDAKSLERSD